MSLVMRSCYLYKASQVFENFYTLAKAINVLVTRTFVATAGDDGSSFTFEALSHSGSKA